MKREDVVRVWLSALAFGTLATIIVAVLPVLSASPSHVELASGSDIVYSRSDDFRGAVTVLIAGIPVAVIVGVLGLLWREGTFARARRRDVTPRSTLQAQAIAGSLLCAAALVVGVLHRGDFERSQQDMQVFTELRDRLGLANVADPERPVLDVPGPDQDTDAVCATFFNRAIVATRGEVHGREWGRIGDRRRDWCVHVSHAHSPPAAIRSFESVYPDTKLCPFRCAEPIERNVRTHPTS